MANKKIYTAVIGDIKNSRILSERGEVQKHLHEVLAEINERYKTEICAKFLITLGDEFQGLLCKPERCLEIIRLIENKLYPVKLRFGVGIGEITTSINEEMALGADGPAFYSAREAITEIKNNERKDANYPNVKFASTEESIDLRQVNSICSLLKFLKRRWTTKQTETIRDLELYGGNQKESAERLGINQSNISRRLVDSGYSIYLQLIDMAERNLGEISKNQCLH